MTLLSFSTWKDLILNTLTLKPQPFELLTSGRPSLRRAIYIVIVIGLLIGTIQAIIGIPALILGPSFDADEFVTQVDQQFETFRVFGGDIPPEVDEFMDVYMESMKSFAPFIEQMEQAKAPLPGFFGRLLTWLGEWLSTPFALLAKWLGISLWIMLFARLLGGRGTLLTYLSASSLSTIPHLLHAFDFIPCLNVLIWLVAGIWGLVIQVKVVEYTHNLSQGRAIFAVILLYLLGVLLIGLSIALMLLTILFGIASN